LFIAVGVAVIIAIVSLVLFVYGFHGKSRCYTPLEVYSKVGSSIISHPFYAKYVVEISEDGIVKSFNIILESDGRGMCLLKYMSEYANYVIVLSRSGDVYTICRIVKTVSMNNPVTTMSIINSSSGYPLQILFYKSGLSGIFNAITVAIVKGRCIENSYVVKYGGYNITVILLNKSGLYIPKLVKIVGKNGTIVMKLVKFFNMYDPLDFDKVTKLCIE